MVEAIELKSGETDIEDFFGSPLAQSGQHGQTADGSLHQFQVVVGADQHQIFGAVVLAFKHFDHLVGEEQVVDQLHGGSFQHGVVFVHVGFYARDALLLHNPTPKITIVKRYPFFQP